MKTIPPLVGETGETSRDCPMVPIPGANGDSPMEIDIFGKRAPTCRGATRRVKAAVARLSEEAWGHIGGWRCIWAQYEVYCAKRSVRIYATNPGG